MTLKWILYLNMKTKLKILKENRKKFCDIEVIKDFLAWCVKGKKNLSSWKIKTALLKMLKQNGKSQTGVKNTQVWQMTRTYKEVLGLSKKTTNSKTGKDLDVLQENLSSQ